jgi:hypothetical protein
MVLKTFFDRPKIPHHGESHEPMGNIRHVDFHDLMAAFNKTMRDNIAIIFADINSN